MLCPIFCKSAIHTVNKGLDVVVASQPCSGRCMDLLSEHAEDLHTLAWPSVWKSAASVVWLWHWNLSACSSWSASVTETKSSPTAFPAWHRAFVASWICCSCARCWIHGHSSASVPGWIVKSELSKVNRIFALWCLPHETCECAACRS